MQEKTKNIAQRIRTMREDRGETQEDVAAKIDLSLDRYSAYESGREDIPASILAEVAAAFGVDMGLLLTGETPRMSLFSVTRKGKGVSIDQKDSYKYENIAPAFHDPIFEPFIITLSPEEVADCVLFLSSPMAAYITGQVITVAGGQMLI